MSKPKFPLNLPPVARKEKSAPQDLAFGRMDLATTIRFISDAGFPDVAGDLARCLEALPAATVHHLGCWRCNGDVPLDRPDLLSDRICPPCADAYDVAAADRKRLMREARRAA